MSSDTAVASYPVEREVDVALRDGTTAHIRPVRADDQPGIRALLDRLSADDRALRFFSAGSNLRDAARQAADVDYVNRYGLVAVAPDDRTILGHGCFIRPPGEQQAEVAFEVDDALRGEGIASTMLAHLAQAASAVGIERLTAIVLPENRRMLEVFRESGLQPTISMGDGEIDVSMATWLGPDALERFDARDAEAAVAAVRHVLRPGSVAVVGASRRPGSVGAAVWGNLLAGGFNGAAYPVNPRHRSVGGVACHPTVEAIGAPVELAVIAVPAAAVLEAAASCARAGVRAIVVVSDGFAEGGADGRERQRQLVALCRDAGMRLVGPNCLGVMTTDPDVRLNASFAPGAPSAGPVAFLSQSGALAIAGIDLAGRAGLGLSSFVSVGNKADLSGNDFLAYWERDEQTSVVMLYLESFGNPRKFSRVARRVAATKPIVAVKGGRSAAGIQAAGSHTGAMLAGSPAAVDALFGQAGVIATDSLHELFDVGMLLAHQPAPRGPRVAIVTNGGGLGILCADACAVAGLDVVALSAPTRTALAEGLADGVALANPIDLLAAAAPGAFAHAIDTLAASDEVDAIIAIYVPPMVSDPVEVAHAIRGAAERAAVPVAAVFAMSEPPRSALGDGSGVPVFRFPEEAAHAVGRAARYGAWRRRGPDPAPRIEADRRVAAAVIGERLARGGGWLAPEEVAGLLDAYGIPRARQRTVATAHAAGRAAAALGGDVALKAIAPGLVHRSDAHAVATGLHGERPVARAATAMKRRLADRGVDVTGFLVQEMVEGVELLTGVVADPVFGPVVVCAAGGTASEILADRSVRLSPLGPRAAAEMLRELRTFPLLDGYRGAPRCDTAAVEDVLLRLAALADAHPQVAEIECNPLIVSPTGAVAVDARVRVNEPAPRPPEPSLSC
jgi:acetyl coenzyme A synthetase (ADP forming)-like protein